MKEKLLGKTLAELRSCVKELGLKEFVGSQLASWMYEKKVCDFDRMTNISAKAKELIQSRYEIGLTPYIVALQSKDGTKKYLFNEEDAALGVETVMIPTPDRSTICVSCQRGCKMGCRFCMTGRQGFHGHLDAAEILSQFISIDESQVLTNAVFMGMGEPLDNYDTILRVIEVLTAPWGFGWSPKRITVSTVGVASMLKRFLDETQVHLALSLHNPIPPQREELMPIEKAFPLYKVIDIIREYDWTGQRRISFEYTLFSGWNDTPAHAKALANLVRGLECRVNLIRFHKIDNFKYQPSDEAHLNAFKSNLEKLGVIATIRASRGEDIMAACGLLAGSHAKGEH